MLCKNKVRETWDSATSLRTKRLYRKTPRHINIKNGIYEMKNEDFFPVSHLDAKNQVLTSLSQLQREVFLRQITNEKNRKTRIIINRAVLCMFQIKIVSSCHFLSHETTLFENLSHIDNIITDKSLKLGIDRTGYWGAKITALQLN